MKLKKEFYLRENVVEIARDLVGKVLVSQKGNIYTSGIITESEAYNGIYDRACHAFNGRRTARTELMYSTGGTSYIYICYGIHHLFNVITNKKDIPDAILIRAVYPLDGVKHMLQRRKKTNIDKTLAGGPGIVSQSLGIHVGLNGSSLFKNEIWIEDRSIPFETNAINITPRIGVESSMEAALLPYRFVIPFAYFNQQSSLAKFRR